MYKVLTFEKKEYVLSKQLLRSATSIGANVCEAAHGQTPPDFYAKLKIADKESAETEYWIELLKRGKYIDETMFYSLKN